MPEANDMDSLGLFSAPASINIGAPYESNKGPKNDDRYKGKQFVTNPSKRGKSFDVKMTFSEFQTNSVGTAYIELGRLQQRARNENAKKQIVPQAFRPSHPSGKPCGSGAYYGAFSKHANMKTTDDYDKRQAKKGEEKASLKNVLTSPAKRGTYGFIGLNIGGTKIVKLCECTGNPAGVNGEFAYVAEPVRPRPATTGGEKVKPFVPSSPAKKGTYGYMQLNINGNKNPHGVNGEYTYATQGLSTDRREKVQPSELKPFYPSNPPKKGSGFYGTMKFDTTQNYVEDPESLKFEAVKAERKAIREKYGNTVFRPSSTPKSLRTSSVANHPRNQEGGHPAAQNARQFIQMRSSAAASA